MISYEVHAKAVEAGEKLARENARLQHQLSTVEATVAEMRALVKGEQIVYMSFPPTNDLEKLHLEIIEKALSHDCGKDWVRKEALEKIEKQITAIRDEVTKLCNTAGCRECDFISQLRTALFCDGSELGLTEEG